MLRSEFGEWLKYHTAAFTSVGSWLGKMPEEGTESTPSRADVVERWFAALRSIDLVDAKAATDELFAGREAEPRGFDRHPAAVAAIAVQLRRRRAPRRDPEPRRIDGQAAYRCLLCRDTGVVDCWAPESMRAAHRAVKGDAEWTGDTIYAVAVACSCDAGDRFARNSEPRYDAKRWLKIEGSIGESEEQQRLLNFMSDYGTHAYEWTP